MGAGYINKEACRKMLLSMREEDVLQLDDDLLAHIAATMSGFWDGDVLPADSYGWGLTGYLMSWMIEEGWGFVVREEHTRDGVVYLLLTTPQSKDGFHVSRGVKFDAKDVSMMNKVTGWHRAIRRLVVLGLGYLAKE